MPRYYDKRALLTILGTLKEAGLSQVEAASLVGISTSYANRIYQSLPEPQTDRLRLIREYFCASGKEALKQIGYTQIPLARKAKKADAANHGVVGQEEAI